MNQPQHRTPSRPHASARPDVGWRLDPVSAVFLLLASILVLHQLMLPPVVGYADNGDFGRVTGPLGLVHSSDPLAREYFYFVDPVYEWTEPGPVEIVSSELLLGGLAVGIHKVFAGDADFDLRLMGGVHAVFYLFGVYLLLVGLQTFPRRVRWLTGLLLLLAVADTPYVIVLNSFYAEAASVIFLIISLGLLLRMVRAQAGSRARTICFYAAVLLFACAKAQNVWLALPLLVAPHLLGRSLRPAARGLKIALAVLVVVVAVATTWRIPQIQRDDAKWNLVFNGILVVSPDPAADLAELGLPADLVAYKGQMAWTPGIPRFETTPQYGLGDLAAFFARHPGRLAAMADRSARDCFRRQETVMASRTEILEGPAGASAPSVTGWGDFERHLFPGSLWFLATVFVLAAGGLAYGWRWTTGDPDGRRLVLASGVLVAMAPVAFLAAVLAEGHSGAIKHFFVFQVVFDAGLIALLGLGMDRLGAFFPGRWWEPTAAVGREDRRRDA